MIRIFFLSLLLQSHPVHSEGTCNIAGQVFLRDESLGDSFVTRCGSAEDFPCFCNPDLDPPVECPYCGFATDGGGLVCGRDGDTLSFVDIDGVDQTCGCSAAPGETPTKDCEIQVGPNPSGTCTIDLPDGTSRTFGRGDSLAAFLPNRCGSDYPCFCNPDLPGQIECPYCRFPGMGGQLFCAGDGETVAFQDIVGVNQMCTCNMPDEAGAEGVSTCSSSPSPPTSAPADFCTLEMPGGEIVSFADGEPFGEYLTTRCGSASDFPCYCNTALPNQIECPYCGFVNGEGELFCAKDEETITFLDGHVSRTCSCEIPGDPREEPIRTCKVSDATPTQAPVDPNSCTVLGLDGELVVIPDGESFGELLTGVCGSSDEWPVFCNAVSDTSRQGNIEYPYCVFENTETGVPVCAKSNEQVTFVDDEGKTQVCGCVYLNPSLGGAQSTCRVETEPPTDSPTEAPGSAAPTGALASLGVAWSVILLWNAMV